MGLSNPSSLRKQTVLELLDRTFTIYRDNFVTFFGLVAAVTVPVTVINLIATFWFSNQLVRSGTFNTTRTGRVDPQAFNGLLGGLIAALVVLIAVGIVVAIIQGVLVNGLLTYIASERTLGRRVTVGQAYAAVRGRLQTLGLGLIFFYAILIALSIGLMVILFACGLGFGLIAYVWVTLYAFLTPVLILERTDVTTGLRRAWMLAKARVWPIVGLMLAVGILSFLIATALSVAGQAITRPTINSFSFGAGQIVQILGQSVVSIFLAPLLPIGLTLLYYDTRIRLEGLDLALQASEVPEPRPSDVASPEPPSGLALTSNDYVNIGLFIVGVLVLFAIGAGLNILILGGASRLFS